MLLFGVDGNVRLEIYTCGIADVAFNFYDIYNKVKIISQVEVLHSVVWFGNERADQYAVKQKGCVKV